jgi:hypothetical protein
MARDENKQRHASFPAEPGMVFPVYLVFSALAGFEVWQAIASTDPRRVIGWGLRGSVGRRRLLLANMTEHPLERLVHGLDGEWHGRWLDEGNARRAFHEPQSFWAIAGERLPMQGTACSLRLEGYSVMVADKAMGSYLYC